MIFGFDRMFERPTPSIHHLKRIHQWEQNIVRLTLPPSYLNGRTIFLHPFFICCLILPNIFFPQLFEISYTLVNNGLSKSKVLIYIKEDCAFVCFFVTDCFDVVISTVTATIYSRNFPVKEILFILGFAFSFDHRYRRGSC